MKDLTKRSVTGVIYIFLMVAGIYLHPVVFAVIFGFFLYLTQLEFYKLIEISGSKPRKTAGLTLGVFFFIICFGMVNNLLPPKSYLIFIPALIFIFMFESFSEKSGILQNSAVTFTGFVYVAVPFSLLNFIIFPGYPVDTTFNPGVLMGTFFIVWVYDSMAYVTGSLLGKHKIYEKISPNKSWEGFIAGTIFALAIGVVNSVVFQQLSIFNWITISGLVVIFGTIGDLFESLIKRRLNVKDSGTILPGHGGLLDRFDSLLFVIPVIFVWLNISGNL